MPNIDTSQFATIEPLDKGMSSAESNPHHGILVFGAPGAGDATLGREVARKLGIPHIELSRTLGQRTLRVFSGACEILL